MSQVRKITGIILTVLLGGVFIFSGWTKLWPVIETLEVSLVDAGFANWMTAPFLARLLIGVEVTLGVMLVAQIRLKRWTLPATFVLLVIFTIYLSINYFKNGNTTNCGCFGETLPMSTLWALAKNLFLLAVTSLCFLLSAPKQRRLDGMFTSLIAVTSLAACFIINPVEPGYTSNNLNESVGYELPLDLLYHPEDSTLVQLPTVELRNGKHVLVFLSLQCEHCRVAAKKIKVIHERNPAIPFYFILNGEEAMKEVFYKDTRTEAIPHSMCLGKTFITLGTTRVPRIYYINNQVVEKKVDAYELHQSAIEEWLKAN